MRLPFVLILFLAIFLRMYQLGSIPPSLNWDEVSHGVNAQSLLQTGKDQWGISWPIFNFRAYGDYPTTANLYLSLPFIKILGLNSLTVRLPSALMGIVLVISSYFIAKYFTRSRKYSLLVMLITAISPWSLFPSRAVFQSTVAQGILPFGFLFFLQGLKKPNYLVLSAYLFGLSMYAYHSTRIAAPIIFAAMVVINIKTLKQHFFQSPKTILVSAAIFLMFTIPSLINLTTPESQARSLWVSLLNPAAINQINENRRIFPGPPILNRLLNNRLTYAVPKIFINFANQFNPIPLFFQGTGQYQFNIPHTGILYPVTLPFFYIGLILVLLRSKKNLIYRNLIAWNIIGLIPSIITTGDFPVIRAMAILPIPFIYIALGIQYVSEKLKYQRQLFVLTICVIFFQFISFSKNYLTDYFKNYSSSWQHGYQQTVTTLKQYYPQYQHIYFTKKYGEPHEFILFYWPWNMKSFQSDPNLKWNYHSNWYWVDGFDKFTFFNDWEPPQNPPPHSLIITSPGNYPPNHAKLLKTVSFLNGQSAFDIVSYD